MIVTQRISPKTDRNVKRCGGTIGMGAAIYAASRRNTTSLESLTLATCDGISSIRNVWRKSVGQTK
jgi:hypothetical protein